jgi:hypothetical protein
MLQVKSSLREFEGAMGAGAKPGDKGVSLLRYYSYRLCPTRTWKDMDIDASLTTAIGEARVVKPFPKKQK